MVAEFEIPVLFLDLDDLAPLGTEISGFVAVALLEELFLADRVESGVCFLVKLALILEPGENAADAGLVALVDGLGPAVVFHVEFLPELGEFPGRAFDEILGGNPFFFGSLLDFLAVLVDAGQKKHLVATQPAVAGDHVGKDLFISMADVRGAVGVVDGGSEIEHDGRKWERGRRRKAERVGVCKSEWRGENYVPSEAAGSGGYESA